MGQNHPYIDKVQFQETLNRAISRFGIMIGKEQIKLKDVTMKVRDNLHEGKEELALIDVYEVIK